MWVFEAYPSWLVQHWFLWAYPSSLSHDYWKYPQSLSLVPSIWKPFNLPHLSGCGTCYSVSARLLSFVLKRTWTWTLPLNFATSKSTGLNFQLLNFFFFLCDTSHYTFKLLHYTTLHWSEWSGWARRLPKKREMFEKCKDEKLLTFTYF